MTDWLKLVIIIIGLSVASIVLVLISAMGSIASQAGKAVSDDSDRIVESRTYFKYSKYDDEKVVGQDAVNLIMESEGKPAVYLFSKGCTNLAHGNAKESFADTDAKYTTEQVSTYFNVSDWYLASLVKQDGEVVEINLVELGAGT